MDLRHMLSYQKKLPLLIVLFGFIVTSNVPASESPNFIGSFEQGGLVLGQLAEGETVSYKGKLLKINSNRQFLLGFGRNEPVSTEITIHNQSGDKNIVINVAPREYKVQKIEGVP